MSSWIGFFVGLALATTVLVTALRPAGSTSPSRKAVALTDSIELAPSATDATASAEPVVEAPRPAPEPPPAALPTPPPPPAIVEAAAPATPVPPPEPATTVETVKPDVADAQAAPAIPAFRWDDVTPPPGGESVGTDALAPARELDSEAPAPIAATQPTQDRQWHAFWQPFSSRLSAEGFSQRLERLTGLDYRVVKVAAGEYHVAFAYLDEANRAENLTAIEAATGLRVGGSSL